MSNTPEPQYAPAPPSVDMEVIRVRAAQGQFLREYADCISPWAFHPNERLKRAMARSVRTWGEVTMRLQREKKS